MTVVFVAFKQSTANADCPFGWVLKLLPAIAESGCRARRTSDAGASAGVGRSPEPPQLVTEQLIREMINNGHANMILTAETSI